MASVQYCFVPDFVRVYLLFLRYVTEMYTHLSAFFLDHHKKEAKQTGNEKKNQLLLSIVRDFAIVIYI